MYGRRSAQRDGSTAVRETQSDRPPGVSLDYCRSYTDTLSYFAPLACVPFCAKVSVLPSFDTVRTAVATAAPAFIWVLCTVSASTGVTDTISKSGLPLSGQGLPSSLKVSVVA